MNAAPPVETLVTDHLDLWTAALKRKSTAGRSSSGKVELYGIRKLRELILELAVRGLLVPQDPNDEPASELLKKIAAEKAKLVKAGKIKKGKSLEGIVEAEKPFQLPNGWEWVRLGNAMTKITDGTHHSPPNGLSGDYLYISAKNIKEDGVQLSNATYVAEDVHLEIFSRCDPKPGNILYIKDGATTGIVTINNLHEPFSMLSSVALLKQPTQIANKYLLFALRAPFFYQEMRAGMTGVAITRVTLKKLEEAVIPLPPFTEQHRIVAKVDELMALCDQLEQQTDASLGAHQTLVETLLSALTSAADHAQFASAWQRIACHFDTLFATEESIAQLKQTILQLAVMGKLIPQNPNDEPASELLKKIAAEKAKLVKEGKIKKGKPQLPIAEEEKPFKVPAGWKLIRFGDLLINRDSERIPLSVDERATRRGEYDYYGASGVIDSIDAYLFDKPLLLIGEDGANLINRSTPIAFMAYGKYWVNNHAHVLDGYSEGLLLYVCLYINAISLEPYVTGTAQPKMNQAKMNGIVVAIPPLAEQHRIVAKVDELMALCDQLKSRLSDAQTTQLHLADALVERAIC
ncbi:restriction endonuclease subunit S [Accumulibacter sp.]|uniref:restriction endonuclease subunit S n=1 Tax=Accumulibacter sp. TaxID=2053492 RepID=UPI001AD0C970|nr:restriction endonuclease subunit S [Accumulibacter sp.]MBN8514965.1 restriction endonuclease subunit S [Accumulibacter sp.]MBO3703532.1 restriction endonuclease subunit S [Accumulibacter sp.]